MSVGLCSSLIITEKGNVYTFGYNKNQNGDCMLGYLTTPEISNNQPIPMKLDYFGPNGIKAVSGSGGAYHHSIIIDNYGNLHGWGSNLTQQIGISNPMGVVYDFPVCAIPFQVYENNGQIYTPPPHLILNHI